MSLRKKIDNPRYPHFVTITRLVVNDNPFSDEEEEEVILYDGIGRVYTDTTTTGSTKMDYNRRKCSIPVRFDKWKEEILDGDKILVNVGKISYSGVINDCEPDNDRTVIYWERLRVTD